MEAKAVLRPKRSSSANLISPTINIPPLAAFTLAPGLMDMKLMNNPAEASYIAVCLAVLPHGMIGLMIAAMIGANNIAIIAGVQERMVNDPSVIAMASKRSAYGPRGKSSVQLAVSVVATVQASKLIDFFKVWPILSHKKQFAIA